jgi:hypothetical protein
MHIPESSAEEHQMLLDELQTAIQAQKQARLRRLERLLTS